MRAVKPKPEVQYVSPTTQVLLSKLGEECQRVLKLLAQLELAGLKGRQVEDILGELGAAVLHLHEHTRGLDTIIDEDLGGK